MQQRNGVDLYLAALHWATMTLTTIGYGDIVPITATERIICFIGQLMGVLVSAYVIGASATVLDTTTMCALHCSLMRVRCRQCQYHCKMSFFNVVAW